jgi:branched-chain amino acid transport system substrate-binding protein
MLRIFQRAAAPLLLATALGSCSQLPEVHFKGGPAQKIGVVGPMSGNLAAFGKELRTGAELAIDNVNKSGGVLGHQLVLEGFDDKCDAKQAAADASRLAVDGVVLVVGHFCSNASIAAAPIYSAQNILEITPASTGPALTDAAAARGSTNIFRLVPRDDMQGPALVDYILAHHPNAPVAVVDDGTDYGQSVAGSTRAALEAAHVRPALVAQLTPDTNDLAPLAQRLKAAGVIVFGGRYQAAARLIVEARKAGVDAVLAGGDSLQADGFWKLAGEAGEGTISTGLPDPRSDSAAKAVTDQFGSIGVDPRPSMLRAYAAVELFAKAAEQAGSLETSAVAKALHDGQYPTVLGPIAFDAKGDLKAWRYVIYVWSDGELRRE